MIYKLILAALTMGLSAEAKTPAACKQAFIELHNEKRVTTLLEHRGSVAEESDLNTLLGIEAQAVRDYQNYVMPEIPSSGLQVSSRAYYSKVRKAVIGYRVEVDGGDEASATFYYAFDRLLYYRWDNQSPVREWVCQGF